MTFSYTQYTCFDQYHKHSQKIKDRFLLQDPDLVEERDGSSQFSSEITPIILAAQYNRFETLMLLLQMGEIIPHPHPFSCPCDQCVDSKTKDELHFAKSRLSSYRGLASDAYISLSSDDPMLRAFQLARELRKVSKREKYYRVSHL